MLVARVEVFKQKEKFFHGAVFARDKLNIVDNQQVVMQILLFKRIPCFVAHGCHKGFQVFIRVHIAHFGFGVEPQQFVADGLHQVGFAQACAAVHEKRVIHAVAWFFGDAFGNICRQLVALAFHQRVKGVIGRKIGLVQALLGGFAGLLGGNGGGLACGVFRLPLGGLLGGAQVAHALG